MRRLYPSLRIAREFLLAGGVGTIERVEAYEGSRWEWPASSSYVIRSPFGGVLYDTGSHVLDSLLFVLGLDEPGTDARAEVIAARRDRPEEPAHDFRAELVLESAELGPVDVDFRVSRTDALVRAIKVHGTSGTLVISGGFAMHPTLIVGGKSFRIDAFVDGPRPSDVMGCFLLEHRALQAAAADCATPSVLDADRFLLLARLLERMAQP
jgi:predicted dehydrogenase